MDRVLVKLLKQAIRESSWENRKEILLVLSDRLEELGMNDQAMTVRWMSTNTLWPSLICQRKGETYHYWCAWLSNQSSPTTRAVLPRAFFKEARAVLPRAFFKEDEICIHTDVFDNRLEAYWNAILILSQMHRNVLNDLLPPGGYVVRSY